MATGALMPLVRYVVMYNGAVAPGAKAYFYASGTNTPQNVYSDASLMTAYTQPVEADAAGVLPPIYFAAQNYRVFITTSTGVTIFPATDDVYDFAQLFAAAALTRVNDANVTLTLGGTPASALLQAVSLTLGWTGQLGLSRGGTQADLSATGGSSQVLRQSSAGADITVGQLAYSDISSLAYGTYTPTLTNVTNVDASTASSCQYCRLGDMVIVSGSVAVNPTSAVATELGISLPIASAFANPSDCAGSANAITIQQGAGITADTANARASMQFIATDTANRSMWFTFAYRVL